jgi:hypothetical protein
LAGSLKTRQLSAVVEVEPVARVAPQPEGVTLDELAAEFDIGRQLVVDILDTYGVAHRRRRARGAATRLHDPKEARAALNHAFGPGGQWDLLAVNRSALRTSDAARRAGVSPKALKSAAEAGELPVHYTRNGMYRFQPDDLDRWTDRR